MVSFTLRMEPLSIPPRKQVQEMQNMQDDYTQEERDGARNDAPKQENFFVEVFKFSILALIIVVPFRFYIAQPFIVSGASMSPTFETGQYLIVDQISYRFEEPHRGDVVIFKYPNDPSKYFIKRIIGLPGEVVELENGTTAVSSLGDDTSKLVLAETYLQTDPTDDHLSITLSSDEYFVMGDNRGASSDSRVWGPVPRKNIVGRAYIRLLPPRTMGILPGSHDFTDDTHTVQ